MLSRDPILQVFARSYEPPLWLIEEFLEAGTLEVQAALSDAIANVSPSAIAALNDNVRAQIAVCFRSTDPEHQARLYLVSQAISTRLQHCRMSAIVAPISSSSPPYDHAALAGLSVDSEGLVALREFDISGDALCRNKHTFFVLPAVPASNANYWLLQQLQRHDLVDVARVRLDPLLHGPESELRGGFFRAAVYGRPLDWDRIKTLKVPEHGRFVPGKLSRPYLVTEYAWIPHDDEVDFVCEELPLESETQVRGARYFHAVYDKRQHCVTHCDGAIRLYSAAELLMRQDSHVRAAGKVGKRIKVFRIDQPVDPDVLGSLAESFFFWNYDVPRYFGADIPDDF